MIMLFAPNALFTAEAIEAMKQGKVVRQWLGGVTSPTLSPAKLSWDAQNSKVLHEGPFYTYGWDEARFLEAHDGDLFAVVEDK